VTVFPCLGCYKLQSDIKVTYVLPHR